MCEIKFIKAKLFKKNRCNNLYNDLKGKTVIVTGASRGIGLAIAKKFIEEGANVYDLDVISPTESIPELQYIRCDVSSLDDVKNAFDKIYSENKAVDVLINNAGVESFGTVTETELSEWNRILGINLTGSFLTSKYALKTMKNVGGVIEFISSIQAIIIQKRLAAYVTSKHALIGLMKSIALDYAPKVRSVAICPGSVRTPLLEWAAVQEVGNDKVKIDEKIREWGRLYPMQRVAEPDEVADLAVFLASERARYITGICIPFDGGLSIVLYESVPEK
ncbi:MAG: SDR family oxidoreductase [Nitrososphaeria archaeon]